MDHEQSRNLAADETTSPEKLRELASSTDIITRQNVVTNPNIPSDVLIDLAAQFPKQIFNNPAIDLLLLETPNLFSGTSANVLCSLLKREVPHRMIEYAANCADERFKLAILMNPQTPPDILELLARSENIEIYEAAKTHINCPQDANHKYEKYIRNKVDGIFELPNKYVKFNNQ